MTKRRRCGPGRRRRTSRTNGVAAITSLRTGKGASSRTTISSGRSLIAPAASVRASSSPGGCSSCASGLAAEAARAVSSHAVSDVRCHSSQGYSMRASPPSPASIAASAAAAWAPSGPPPWAKSAPAAAAGAADRGDAAAHQRHRVELAGQILGDADHHRGLAVVDADQRHDARAQLLLDRVGGAAQLLGRHAVQRAGGEADLAHLLEAVAAGAAADGELAAQVGRLALQPPALLDQRLEPGRQVGAARP